MVRHSQLGWSGLVQPVRCPKVRVEGIPMLAMGKQVMFIHLVGQSISLHGMSRYLRLELSETKQNV